MINASDPLEYIPNGRLTILKHPEFDTAGAYKFTDTFQSTSKKLLNASTESRYSKDFWILRDNENHQEEELFCSGRLAIHSKGNQVTNTLQTAYCCETNILHAVWCKFYVNDKNQILKAKQNNFKKSTKGAVDCICLLDSYTLKVFTEFGENYISSLPFKVSAVWPTKYGILLAKSVPSNFSYGMTSLENTKSISETEEQNSPILYSLTHPLDDICPVIIKHGKWEFIHINSELVLKKNS